MKGLFRKIASKISIAMGHSSAFLIALLIVVIWGISGPVFNYSDTWQLAINTGTTVVTFLMVFLIQNTQNRDSKAMQLKLDELIRSTRARDAFVDLEDLNDEELAELDKEFQAIREKQSHSSIMVKLHKTIQIEHDRRKKYTIDSTSINNLLRIKQSK